MPLSQPWAEVVHLKSICSSILFCEDFRNTLRGYICTWTEDELIRFWWTSEEPHIFPIIINTKSQVEGVFLLL